MFLTIGVALVTLSVLIIFHELGHFLVAKKTGIKVEEFGLGYPPRLWGKEMGGTTYSINLIPFGGFVRLYGENKVGVKREKGAFWAKGKLVRLAVISAGVLANVFLAWLLFTTIYLIAGIPMLSDKVTLEAVMPGSPAEQAGIKPGDVAVSFAGETVSSVAGFVDQVEAGKGEKSILVLEREEGRLEVEIVPRVDPKENEGPLGVVVTGYELVRLPFGQMILRSMSEGARETYGWGVLIIETFGKMLGDLFSKGQLPEDVAGPVGIIQVTSQVARAGFLAILQFVAILSINLAIINFLPFPALDGGRLLFLLIETLLGRRSPVRVEKWVNSFGMVFILFLMILVTINDFKRILLTTEWGMRIRSFWPF
jgi:regulator of sigma E protease